ncbi:MAG: hypothetical protein SGILL_001849 [Bacillariaceae sp.]
MTAQDEAHAGDNPLQNNPELCVLLEVNDDSSEEEPDDFVFSDQAHNQLEFESFSASLANFGLLDKDLVDDVIADTHETQAKQQKRRTSSAAVMKVPSASLASSTTSQQRRESKLIAYHEGADSSFFAVMQEVEAIQEREASKGMSNQNFTFGLLNCLFIAYVFGAFPQHFWILYIVETVFWVGWKLYKSWIANPCEIYYYLDYCWVMNFSGVLLLLTFIVLGNEQVDAHATIIPTESRKQIFLAAFGTYVGPVFLASMALPFVAFLFHDVNTMANLIIHLMPSMSMYCLRWHAVALHEAYPTFFNVQYLKDVIEASHNEDLPYWAGFGKGSVVRNGLIVYWAWWIPYTLWMLIGGGLQIPRVKKEDSGDIGDGKKKRSKTSKDNKIMYDTVFHSLWRGGPCELVGKLLWNRPKAVSQDQSQRNDFEARDFMVYMAGHAVACVTVGIGVVAGISYLGGRKGHALMLLFSTVMCAERGAQRYTYYVTAMYGNKLRKAYKEAQANRAGGAASSSKASGNDKKSK